MFLFKFFTGSQNNIREQVLNIEQLAITAPKNQIPEVIDKVGDIALRTAKDLRLSTNEAKQEIKKLEKVQETICNRFITAYKQDAESICPPIGRGSLAAEIADGGLRLGLALLGFPPPRVDLHERANACAQAIGQYVTTSEKLNSLQAEGSFVIQKISNTQEKFKEANSLLQQRQDPVPVYADDFVFSK